MAEPGSQQRNSPIDTPKGERRKETLEFFGIFEQPKKETAVLILQAVRDLFEHYSRSLITQASVKIGDEIITIHYAIFETTDGNITARLGIHPGHGQIKVYNSPGFNKGEVSTLSIGFDFKSGFASGKVDTLKDFEGRGYGSALVLTTNAVMNDVIRRYPDRIPHDGLQAIFTDQARGQTVGKNYAGLNSVLSTSMGYARQQSEGAPTFLKVYAKPTIP